MIADPAAPSGPLSPLFRPSFPHIFPFGHAILQAFSLFLCPVLPPFFALSPTAIFKKPPPSRWILGPFIPAFSCPSAPFGWHHTGLIPAVFNQKKRVQPPNLGLWRRILPPYTKAICPRIGPCTPFFPAKGQQKGGLPYLFRKPNRLVIAPNGLYILYFYGHVHPKIGPHLSSMPR